MNPAINKAAEAALHAHGLVFNLLAASSDYTSPEQKLDYMKRAFTSWACLQPRMRELESLAKNSSAKGYAEAESLREIAGGRP